MITTSTAASTNWLLRSFSRSVRFLSTKAAAAAASSVASSAAASNSEADSATPQPPIVVEQSVNQPQQQRSAEDKSAAAASAAVTSPPNLPSAKSQPNFYNKPKWSSPAGGSGNEKYTKQYFKANDSNFKPLSPIRAGFYEDCKQELLSDWQWTLSPNEELKKSFTFKTYYDAINFVNNVASKAYRLRIFPDIYSSKNLVIIQINLRDSNSHESSKFHTQYAQTHEESQFRYWSLARFSEVCFMHN